MLSLWIKMVNFLLTYLELILTIPKRLKLKQIEMLFRLSTKVQMHL